ncbi:hypothetical protein [Salinigranum sp.]|uniref:hypothetical protein n=1 Tax=Salinigranum sp. TaxID=1966351 RepID=UPI00356AFC44
MTDADAPANADERTTATRVRRGLDYALLGGLAFLGLVAAIQFYLAADQTINVWVTREYRPPFKMVFNLVVLLVVGIGLSRQVRRLSGSDTETAPDTDTAAASAETTGDGGVESPSATDDDLSPSATDAPERSSTDGDGPDDSGDRTNRS